MRSAAFFINLSLPASSREGYFIDIRKPLCYSKDYKEVVTMDFAIEKMDRDSVEIFWKLREALLRELGEINKETDICHFKEATTDYYMSHINKDLLSWVAMADKKAAAIGSICIFDRVPYPENIPGREGYVLNIYTSEEFRRQGAAALILDEMIKYSMENGIKKLWLSSSDQGEKLYLRKGFKFQGNSMELFV